MHHHHAPGVSPSDRVTRWLWIAVGACGVITVVAVALLWSSADRAVDDPLLLEADTVSAEVISIDLVPCEGDLTSECKLVGFEVRDEPYAGAFDLLEQPATSPVSVGDGIVLVAFETEAGEVVFTFFDFERGRPMLVLLALFVGAVLALGRWRGLGALAGLAFSLVVIVAFTLPTILDGGDAVAVALASASLIAFAALFLAHGFEVSTAVALLSTFASLVITAVLAVVFVGATNLTGLADDTSFLLGGLAGDVDPRGILLAGIVIGALGVLDDVTVTQVSAVWELARARPEASTRELVVPAMRIGRDHISSTVNTLFLAYVGAALPLLLLFVEAGQGVSDVVTRELVATEVVRALVGSIGLVASVPISTWLAAFVVRDGADERVVSSAPEG